LHSSVKKEINAYKWVIMFMIHYLMPNFKQ
jgi:hypothetical protein